MNLLAVDTATEACSVALSVNGHLTEKFQVVGNRHSQIVLPLIDDLLNEAGLTPNQLNGLAFGRGPGSFTGVRIATGVIQGLAFGLNLPVVPVSNLQALAQAHFEQNSSCNIAFVAVDARMQEIYWGVYQRNSHGYAELIGKEAVLAANAITFPEIKGVGLGSAWLNYGEILSKRLDQCLQNIDAGCLPHAATIAKLGLRGFSLNQQVPVEQAMPVYLRDKVALKEWER